MQWVGYAELASAVSNAGGLGIVRSSQEQMVSMGMLSSITAHSPHSTDARRPAQGDPKDENPDEEPLRRQHHSPTYPQRPSL